MKVNPKCRIEIMHSKRGLVTLIKTWSELGFEWFGPKHPDLPKILEELRRKGVCIYQTEETGGAFTFKRLDPIYID